MSAHGLLVAWTHEIGRTTLALDALLLLALPLLLTLQKLEPLAMDDSQALLREWEIPHDYFLSFALSLLSDFLQPFKSAISLCIVST